jgi:hypothetical protein
VEAKREFLKTADAFAAVVVETADCQEKGEDGIDGDEREWN